jgi:hypothetical protein
MTIQKIIHDIDIALNLFSDEYPYVSNHQWGELSNIQELILLLIKEKKQDYQSQIIGYARLASVRIWTALKILQNQNESRRRAEMLQKFKENNLFIFTKI